MRRLRFVAAEALHEAGVGLRSRVVHVLFVVLALYTTMVLTNAGYLREMGAIDVPRNAPSVVYMMSAGQMLWMIMAWAWLFAQPLVRDRRAQLTEVVLATPVPLRDLLVARYLGGVIVGSLLGLSTAAGILLVTPLEAVGLFPAGTVGPIPWSHLMFSWLTYTVPVATGLGAMYTMAAWKTRGMSGPMGLSALLVLSWMFSMVIMKSGDIEPFVRGIVDSSLYAETLRQVEQMTPVQRNTAYVTWNTTVAANRALWALVPLLVLSFVIRRVTREHLVLELSPRGDHEAAYRPPADGWAHFPRPVKPSWLRAFGMEVAWQLRQVAGSTGVRFSAGLLLFMCLAGSMVHVLQHAEGPFLPRPFLIAPKLAEFLYLVVAFVIAGVGGGICRRDDVPGFSDVLDACPAPEWVRYAGRVTTVALVTLSFTAIPAVAASLLTAVWTPEAFSLTVPWVYQVGLLGPALLEVAALVVLTHAAFRNAGMAHTMSVVLVFVVVMNHELDLVSYPTFEVAIPVHAHPSALTGLSPFAGPMAAGAALKLCFATLLAMLGALLLPRGAEALGLRRLRRLQGGLSVGLLAFTASWLALAAVQYRQFVVLGDYESSTASLASQAAWERDAFQPGVAWSVAGGHLDVRVDRAQWVHGEWALEGVKVDGPTWTAQVPRGFTLASATVAGASVRALVDHDQLSVPMDGCHGACAVTLSWTLPRRGWSAEGQPAPIGSAGVWLDAATVAPRLGVDPGRFLASPAERALHGLPRAVPRPARDEATARGGVAPAGAWTYRVTIDTGDAPRTRQGAMDGPLNFVAWQSDALSEVDAGHGVTAYVPFTHHETAAHIAADLHEVRQALERRAGPIPEVHTLVQAPRHWGEPVLANGVLLLPEDRGWDIAQGGPGHRYRRADLARRLAQAAVFAASDVRDEPGSVWRDEGVPGALGMLAVGDVDGRNALLDLLAHAAQDTTEAFASSRSPVGPLAEAPRAGWIEHYVPLAMLHWVDGQAEEALRRHLRAGPPPTALTAALRATPRASDLRHTAEGVTGTRSAWVDGGWVDDPSPVQSWSPTAGLHLDAWTSFERSPGDNVRTPR